MKLKRADLREKKANSDHFYVGNKLVYDFIAANMTKKKDCGTKLKKKSYVLSSRLSAILNLAAEKINCYEMRSNVLIDDVS